MNPLPVMSSQSTSHNSALVLFSGGQDSTVCLVWALERYNHVETIGFDYGQRHRIELTCRTDILRDLCRITPDWTDKLGADHLLTLPALNTVSDTALTKDMQITFAQTGLPNTFVPGRNLLFFTYAAALAYRRGLRHLVGGMCETDFSGYPDCRNETLRALQKAISLGMEKPFQIDTPLMWLNKEQTWELAHRLGGQPLIDFIIDETHTCYLGDHTQKHDWGYGCAQCPACDLRRKGYEDWTSNHTSLPHKRSP